MNKLLHVAIVGVLLGSTVAHAGQHEGKDPMAATPATPNQGDGSADPAIPGNPKAMENVEEYRHNHDVSGDDATDEDPHQGKAKGHDKQHGKGKAKGHSK